MINTSIGSVLNLKRGYDLTKDQMNEGDIPVVGSNGIIGYHNKFNVKRPVITVGRSGTVGKPHLYFEDCWVHNTALYIDDFKGNNPEYLFYLLKGLNIDKVASSTGVPTLNRNFVHPIKINFENDLGKQNDIAKILMNIDLKIANNSEINEELELMAKTLYEYWFLQFEFPNEEGKPYKSSGGKLEWSEDLKREIPKGWEVENLMESTLCEDIKAGVDYFQVKNYIPTANINGENIAEGENVTFDNRENRANMQPIKYSVWFAKMKNSVKHLTIPDNSDWFIDKYILSTGFQGLKCNKNTISFIHSLVNSGWFENYKDVLSHGATQESINNEDLRNIRFAVPTNKILVQFSNIIYPLLEKKFSVIKENQELTSLRDFLLPMLMNGQVTFK